MAGDTGTHSDSTLASAIRAAAEGAATGTAATVAALGRLEGAVVARQEDTNRRLDQVRQDFTELRTRWDERDDRLAIWMEKFGARIELIDQRVVALEASRRSVAVWAREMVGWLVGAAALLYSGLHH